VTLFESRESVFIGLPSYLPNVDESPLPDHLGKRWDLSGNGVEDDRHGISAVDYLFDVGWTVWTAR
jgi:hypothetical protein